MKKMGVSLLHPWTHLQLAHPIFSTTGSGLSHVQAWAKENKNRRRYVTKFLIVRATPPPYWWLCPQAQPYGTHQSQYAKIKDVQLSDYSPPNPPWDLKETILQKPQFPSPEE